MNKLSDLLKSFALRKTIKQDSPSPKGSVQPAQSQSIYRADKEKDADKQNVSNAKPSEKAAAIYNGVYGNWNEMMPDEKSAPQAKSKEVDPVTLTYKNEKRFNRPPSSDVWRDR